MHCRIGYPCTYGSFLTVFVVCLSGLHTAGLARITPSTNEYATLMSPNRLPPVITMFPVAKMKTDTETSSRTYFMLMAG